MHFVNLICSSDLSSRICQHFPIIYTSKYTTEISIYISQHFISMFKVKDGHYVSCQFSKAYEYSFFSISTLKISQSKWTNRSYNQPITTLTFCCIEKKKMCKSLCYKTRKYITIFPTRPQCTNNSVSRMNVPGNFFDWCKTFSNMS